MDKVAQLVKIAQQINSEEKKRQSRQAYRAGGAVERRKRKIKQRKRRRMGGETLKTRVKMQTRRLEYKPVRIRKEPLQKRPRDKN